MRMDTKEERKDGTPEVARKRVSLAGKVLDSAGAPVGNAVVTLSECPPAFQLKVDVRRDINRQARRKVLEPLEEARTAPDGIFFFESLPPGQYTVTANVSGRTKTASASKPVEVGTAAATPPAIASIELKLGNPEKQVT
jgi:protocatechuate 3,4-dioxygenase beta subunit